MPGFPGNRPHGRGAGEVFQIGTNREISMGGLFQFIAGLMGSKTTPVTDAERLRPGGRLIKPARYCWLLDESRLTRPLFGAMVR